MTFIGRSATNRLLKCRVARNLRAGDQDVPRTPRSSKKSSRQPDHPPGLSRCHEGELVSCRAMRGASPGSGWLVTASRRKGRVVPSGYQAASNLMARGSPFPDGLGGYPDRLGGYPRWPGW